MTNGDKPRPVTVATPVADRVIERPRETGDGPRIAAHEDQRDAEEEREQGESDGHDGGLSDGEVPTTHESAAQNHAENAKRHLDGSDVEVGLRSGDAELNLEILG